MRKRCFCVYFFRCSRRGLDDVTSPDLMMSFDLDVIQEDDVIRVELKMMMSSGNVNLKDHVQHKGFCHP